MCMCGKPTKNGEPGYRWNSPETSTRPVNAPELREGDAILFDEPGRCAPQVNGKGASCGHDEVQISAWVYANGETDAGGDSPVDNSACDYCEDYETSITEADDFDPYEAGWVKRTHATRCTEHERSRELLKRKERVKA